MTLSSYPGYQSFRITAAGAYAPGRGVSLAAIPGAGVTQLRPAYLKAIIVEDPNDAGTSDIEIYDQFSVDGGAVPTTGFKLLVQPSEFPGAALLGASWHLPVELDIRQGLLVVMRTANASVAIIYQSRGMSSPFNAANFIARR